MSRIIVDLDASFYDVHTDPTDPADLATSEAMTLACGPAAGRIVIELPDLATAYALRTALDAAIDAVRERIAQS